LVIGPARGGPDGNPAQLEHGEQVRVRQLVLEAETDDLEVPQGQVALERHQRQPALA